MSIDPLGIIPIDLRGNPGAPASSDSSVMGRDEFLRLLVTQLGNQDPLNPLEGQEFAAQLAQFTSVEQLINIDETLSQQSQMNALLAQSMNNGVAAGLIGQTIEAPGNQLNWDGENASSGQFSLEGNSVSAKIEIRDSSGFLIRTVDYGALGKGDQDFTWDGKDDAGNSVAEGVYTTSVVAKDSNGADVASNSTIRGAVSRVTFSPEGVFLWIGQLSVSMSSVESVGESA
ncbi:MAG: flagellar basal-body rod modification protein FlgD [Rhodothermales bacterium]|jgi:flagellar basal-body rod modification protein FlgD